MVEKQEQGYETHSVELLSLPLSLEALPLPEIRKPEEFRGAVGRFNLNVEVSPNEVMVGEKVTMKIIITGEGNFDTVSRPVMKDVDGFKVYTPRGKKEKNRKK